MSDEIAVPCETCGHDARAHTAAEGAEGCLYGWGQGPTSWRTACQCERFGYAGASAWVVSA